MIVSIVSESRQNAFGLDVRHNKEQSQDLEEWKGMEAWKVMGLDEYSGETIVRKENGEGEHGEFMVVGDGLTKRIHAFIFTRLCCNFGGWGQRAPGHSDCM